MENNSSPNSSQNSTLEDNILITYHFFRILISVAAIFANGLTVVAICKYAYLRNSANMLIMSLAVSDLLNSSFVAPLSVVVDLYTYDLHANGWRKMCTAKQVFQLALNGAGFGSLFLIAVDRYVSVIHAFRYEIILTVKKIIIILSTMWTLTVFATLIVTVVFGKENGMSRHCSYTDVIKREIYLGAVIPTFLLYLIGMCILYFRIAMVARGHVKQIANQTASLDRDGSRKYRREAQMRITKTMGIVLGLYFFMYVPSLVSNSFVKNDSHVSLKALNYVLGLFWWSNAWLNPIIYAWRCPNFNHAFKTLIFFCGDEDGD